jgi:hypothetical protein
VSSRFTTLETKPMKVAATVFFGEEAVFTTMAPLDNRKRDAGEMDTRAAGYAGSGVRDQSRKLIEPLLFFFGYAK